MLTRVDTRAQVTSIAPQELLTADGVTVKVTAALTWRVADAARHLTASRDPLAEVYLAVQLVLREQLVVLEVADLLQAARDGVGAALTERARLTGEPLGLEVRAAVVKDVVLPAELRSACAELVATRQRGLARLEAARAETAALRSLAQRGAAARGPPGAGPAPGRRGRPAGQPGGHHPAVAPAAGRTIRTSTTPPSRSSAFSAPSARKPCRV